MFLDTNPYIHGYDPLEQARLKDQAAYWRRDLILPDLPYQAGESLLDLGCGAGAVLAELGHAFPGLALAGLDLSARQIGAAKTYLKSLGLRADLRVGNALEAPWKNGVFDHIYMMWFLEHVSDPVAILKKARMLLKPGGTITINETDYTTLVAQPETPAICELRGAFCELFNKAGRAVTGPWLATWLEMAGFESVESRPLRWEFGPRDGDLGRHAEYMLGFIEPSLHAMGALPRRSRKVIEQGIADVRAAARHSHGRIGLTPWRARARRPRL